MVTGGGNAETRLGALRCSRFLFLFRPHFARTSCVNPLLLRRACRSVDHRAYQTNSRGFVKHTRSFKVNIGRLIWKSMTTMTGYIRRASFSELSAVHLSELLLSGKRLDDDDDRDKKQLRFRKRRYTKSFTRTLTKTYSRHISFAFLTHAELASHSLRRRFLSSRSNRALLFFGLEQKKFIILTSV